MFAQSVNAGEVGNVAANALRPVSPCSKIGGDLLDPGLVPAGEDNRRVHRRQLASYGVSDAAASSGHHRDRSPTAKSTLWTASITFLISKDIILKDAAADLCVAAALRMSVLVEVTTTLDFPFWHRTALAGGVVSIDDKRNWFPSNCCNW